MSFDQNDQPARATGGQPDKAPAAPAGAPPSHNWLQPVAIGGGVLLLGLVAAVFLRGTPETPSMHAETGVAQADTEEQSATRHTDTQDRVTEQRIARSGPDIVGEWEIFVPGPQGQPLRWIMAFRADGSYLFTDTSNGASHGGSYQAEDGKWSLNGTWTRNPVFPPGTPFSDSGSYAVSPLGTLQLQGQFGTGNWSQTKPDP